MHYPARRSSTFVPVVAALLIAACANQDSLTAVAPSRQHADLLGIDLGLDDLLKRGDTQTTVLVIDPAITSTYYIPGAHRLWVRAGGICDLKSDYGSGTWDLPCLSAILPTIVVARSWVDANGHPGIEFSPALRFLPAKEGEGSSAELWLRDRSAAWNTTAIIRYCTEKECVDEGAKDSSMVTLHDLKRGYLYRRIKHFSGYQVSTGREDEPPTDPLEPDK